MYVQLQWFHKKMSEKKRRRGEGRKADILDLNTGGEGKTFNRTKAQVRSHIKSSHTMAGNQRERERETDRHQKKERTVELPNQCWGH